MAEISGSAESDPVIVGVGASAGGIEALQTFFDEIGEAPGAAFVVVVHLDPDAPSQLAAVLGAHTRMPVHQVLGAEKVEANRIYVIPPNMRLAIDDESLSVSAFDEPRGQRAPIDLFFRSLADHGDGFAVVLSGAGSDGALGVRAVKEAGGIILVQEPKEAQYGSMPRSAIATGVVDFALPIRELAGTLLSLIQGKRRIPRNPAEQVDDELLRRVLTHLRVRTGHDFGKYKRSTVLRRVARRMQVNRVNTFDEYYDLLRESQGEADALLDDLLISVTTFFRDHAAFDALSVQVLPRLFEGRQPADTIRVWVPGCATGEEAYSIAMLLFEQAGRHDVRPAFQVFGSDLDARALATAREGRFPLAIEADVSEERLRRFFTRDADHYRVRQELRDAVLFAAHNVLKDPPFSRIDLISCRNLLIYLDRELQQQVCATFHYALRAAGYLFLGSSESADAPAGLFRAVDRACRIYQSTTQAGQRPRLLPRLIGGVTLAEPPLRLPRSQSPSTSLTEATMHRRAIEERAPPSALVDEAHRVIHLSENAGRFIQPSGGTLSGDVVDLVRPELRFDLRAALHAAFEQNKSTLSAPIAVRFNGSPHRVHIYVQPVAEESPAVAPTALVIFIEGEPIPGEADLANGSGSGEAIRRLTRELEFAQSRMRTMREESEAANEELRAANEELQSINEEYRSTAEELETSKEELQSINEELQTVNSELKLKLEAVSRANSDLQNLMAATDFGTLFLDSALRIKRFTDRVTELFSITANDEGRPITDFAHQLEYDNLIRDARSVLADLAPVQREIRSRSGRWYDMRMRPYRTVDDKIDGVVITFIDITHRLEIEGALRAGEIQQGQLKRLIELSRDPIFVWDFDGGIVEWNRGSEDLYGYRREEVLGKRKEEVLRTLIPGSSFADMREKLLAEGAWSGELHQRTKDGRALVVESRLQLDTLSAKRLVLESTRDITERKEWEQRQRLLLSELTHRVGNMLTVVQAIARQTLLKSGPAEDFVERFQGRIAALAEAHRLLQQSEWLTADLGDLVRSQIMASHPEAIGRIDIHGEPVVLNSETVMSLGLVLHELIANAERYGALSSPTGRVELKWHIADLEGAPRLAVSWVESGGPKIEASDRKFGFGSALLEAGIPSATASRQFLEDGLVCTLNIPLERDARTTPAAQE